MAVWVLTHYFLTCELWVFQQAIMFWGLPPYLMYKYFSSGTEDSIICGFQWFYYPLFNPCCFLSNWFDRHPFLLCYINGTALSLNEQDVWFQTPEYQLELIVILNSVWHASMSSSLYTSGCISMIPCIG